MNGELKNYAHLDGKVVSLSHTFRIVNHPLFIIELETQTGTHFILVRRAKHHIWHKDINPGSYYSITNLKKDVIYKNSYNIDILTTSHLSNIYLVKEGHYEFVARDCVLCDEEVSGFQGKVTYVIDEEIGIYKLGNIALIASYLKDVSVELSSTSPDNTIVSEELSSFRVGDELSIYNAHCIKGRDEAKTLVCCGKSLIKCKRSSTSVSEGFVSNNGILHCLHTFNFGLTFLYWLWDLQKLFLSKLFKDELPERIKSRKYEDEKGLLWKYVEEQLKDQERKQRSLVLEFLLSNHTCVLQQAFDGLVPTDIDFILNYDNLHSVGNTLNDISSVWTYSSLGKNFHQWVIFGTLNLNDVGTLQIESNDKRIDVAVVGQKDSLFSKVGDVVACFNFDYVKEEFDLFEGHFDRKYIVLRAKHIISIKKTKAKSVNKDIDNKLNHYELKIKSISGLNFFTNDLKKNEINGFFIANTFINLIDHNGKVDNWNNIIRFKGKLASKLHSFLAEPCIINGKLRSKNVADCTFRKTFYFAMLKQFAKHIGFQECSEAPTDFEVESVVNLVSKSTDTIKNIQEGHELCSTFVNIEGKIIQKWFMSPKFESQVVHVPVSLLKAGIGTPGSKIIRLLIQDKNDPGISIWVYFNGNPHYLPLYNLGLIPGTEVNISWLERCVSQKGSVYLTGTPFSVVTITNFEILNSKKLVAKHHFIKELFIMSSGYIGLIFATISCILNVKLNVICSSCQSDIENGVCSFVGCHINGPGVISGFAKVLVDDGTETASIFIKDTSLFKTLFCINDTQWDVLNKMAMEAPLTFAFQFQKSKSFHNRNDMTLAELLTNPQIFRPLKIICRIFPAKDTFLHSNRLELFALELADVNPIMDVEILKRKHLGDVL